MRLLTMLAIASVLVPTVAAHADTLTTFEIEGFGAYVTIDTTVGSAVSGTTIEFNDDTLTFTGSTVVAQSGYALTYQGDDPDLSFLDSYFLLLDNAQYCTDALDCYGTLVGYTGGTGVLFLDYPPSPSAEVDLVPVTATPEPSSFALLGTGLLGVAGVLKRRYA